MEPGICKPAGRGAGMVPKRRAYPGGATRFPFKKCCDHADVVKTRFNVNKTTAGDEWYWLDGEKWRRIPDDVIHWDQHAPNGQPTLFVFDGKETCFFPGDGAI